MIQKEDYAVMTAMLSLYYTIVCRKLEGKTTPSERLPMGGLGARMALKVSRLKSEREVRMATNVDQFYSWVPRKLK